MSGMRGETGMKRILACILACLPMAGVAAEGGFRTVSSTVVAAGLSVRVDDFSVIENSGQFTLFWDTLPSRAELKALAFKEHTSVGLMRRAVATALVQGPMLSKYPKARRVWIEIVEALHRDYGATLDSSGPHVVDQLDGIITEFGRCIYMPKATSRAGGVW